MNSEPWNSLQALTSAVGRTAGRLVALDACEGAAGNLSIFFQWTDEIEDLFPHRKQIELPVPAPALAGGVCLVTGSGQRLGDIPHNPLGTLGIIRIEKTGTEGTLYTADACGFERVTSEFNSHLAVHQERIARHGGNFHAVIHVQPKHVTFLSHIPEYQEPGFLNRHLLRWQPEMILQFPKGVGVLPFLPPASPALMQASRSVLEELPLVIWSKHGVLARSDTSLEQAVDLIEYVEAAAHYEYLNRTAGSLARGLSIEEMNAICRVYGVQPDILKVF